MAEGGARKGPFAASGSPAAHIDLSDPRVLAAVDGVYDLLLDIVRRAADEAQDAHGEVVAADDWALLPSDAPPLLDADTARRVVRFLRECAALRRAQMPRETPEQAP